MDPISLAHAESAPAAGPATDVNLPAIPTESRSDRVLSQSAGAPSTLAPSEAGIDTSDASRFQSLTVSLVGTSQCGGQGNAQSRSKQVLAHDDETTSKPTDKEAAAAPAISYSPADITNPAPCSAAAAVKELARRSACSSPIDLLSGMSPCPSPTPPDSPPPAPKQEEEKEELEPEEALAAAQRERVEKHAKWVAAEEEAFKARRSFEEASLALPRAITKAGSSWWQALANRRRQHESTAISLLEQEHRAAKAANDAEKAAAETAQLERKVEVQPGRKEEYSLAAARKWQQQKMEALRLEEEDVVKCAQKAEEAARALKGLEKVLKEIDKKGEELVAAARERMEERKAEWESAVQVAIDACELAKAAAKHHAELLEAAERRRLQKEKEEAQEALFKRAAADAIGQLKVPSHFKVRATGTRRVEGGPGWGGLKGWWTGARGAYTAYAFTFEADGVQVAFETRWSDCDKLHDYREFAVLRAKEHPCWREEFPRFSPAKVRLRQEYLAKLLNEVCRVATKDECWDHPLARAILPVDELLEKYEQDD